MTGTHAPLAPSSAAVTVQCPGSVKMQEHYPEDGTDPEKAAEGEAAHWCLSEMAVGVIVPVGQPAPNGVLIDADMIDAAQIMLDDIEATLGPNWPRLINVESRLSMPKLHPLNWGTPDIWARVGDVIYVWDFKYGYEFVEVFENYQLLDYKAGVIEAEQIDGLQDQRMTARLCIVQPRSYHRDGPVRVWQPRLSDTRGYDNIMSGAFHQAMGENPPLRVGPGCKHCRARRACPELQRVGMRGADVAASAVPFDLPPDALGVELSIIDEAIRNLEARKTGLAEQGMMLIRQGKQVPGWAIGHGDGRDRWVRSVAEVLQVGKMMGVEVAKPVELITPKQAIAAGLNRSLVEAYSKPTPGAAKLVQEDGVRARKVFSC